MWKNIFQSTKLDLNGKFFWLHNRSVFKNKINIDLIITDWFFKIKSTKNSKRKIKCIKTIAFFYNIPYKQRISFWLRFISKPSYFCYFKNTLRYKTRILITFFQWHRIFAHIFLINAIRSLNKLFSISLALSLSLSLSLSPSLALIIYFSIVG
jgi:hypothetical protein